MRKWLVLGIFVFAFLIRIIGIGNHPVGFTPDEASFGYDAYSILKTGKDQWGHKSPLSLFSFGDSKLPLYTYLDIPFVAMLGVNEVAVRLPNAILGSMAVIIVYFLVKKISEPKDETLAIISAFFLAVSPWHIQLSRGAFEANLTTFFLPLAVLLFLKGRKNKKILFISGLVFGLNLFTYHTARFLTPLIVVFLVSSSWKEIKRNIHWFAIPFAVLVLLASLTFLTGSGTRVASAGLFNPTDDWIGVSKERYDVRLAGLPDFIARIYHNKVTYFTQTFIANYLSYFSPQYLFTQGPAEATYGMVPGLGVIYSFEAIFIIGLIIALVRKETKNLKLFIFWVLIGPIPAALSKGPGFAANRAVFVLPAVTILIAFGALYLFRQINKPTHQKIALLAFIVVFVISFLNFSESYFYKQRVVGASSMLYGVGDLVRYVSTEESNYKEIIFSKKISEPQIYVSFYKKLDPKIVQEASLSWMKFIDEGFDWVDQMGVYHLDKYTFKNIDWKTDTLKNERLFVGQVEDFPENIKVKKTIYYPTGRVAYIVVDPLDQ